MDFSDEILDIEGYDMTLPSFINPSPTRMYPIFSANTGVNFIFIAHRTNNLVD